MSKVHKKSLNTLWMCSIEGRPNAIVGITEDNRIKISMFLDMKSETSDGFAFCVDRRLARLLAKRINQCLEQTGRRG